MSAPERGSRDERLKQLERENQQLQRQNERLQQQIEQLRKQLEEALRANKRQAAPFREESLI